MLVQSAGLTTFERALEISFRKVKGNAAASWGSREHGVRRRELGQKGPQSWANKLGTWGSFFGFDDSDSDADDACVVLKCP